MLRADSVTRSIHTAAARPEFPNFDYLRLLAAALVILSHSYSIAEGNEANEPMVRLIGGGFILGIFAVCAFFMISGFLITMSAVKSRTIFGYGAARVLRIYPALIVCQTLTALVLGAAFSSSGPSRYILDLNWLRYAFHYSIIDVANSWDIPTVLFFMDPKGTGAGLNGTLWTIHQELVCYVIIGIMRITGLLRWWGVLVVLGMVLPYLVPWSRDNIDVLMNPIQWSIDSERVYDFFWVAASFFSGSFVYFLWSLKQRLPAWPMLGCAVIFGWAIHRHHYYDLFPLYFAYPLLWFATNQKWRLPSLKKFGDISYGLYLYGWPAQVAIRGWWGPAITWWQLWLLATLAASMCGYVSWHLLEQPMLSLKRFLSPSFVPKGPPGDQADDGVRDSIRVLR